MAKNWAIAIGVNQYDYLQPLNYAKRDAQLMQEFLCNEAEFEQVFFFSEDSPDIAGKSTRPTHTNLLRILRQLFENPFMSAGDNFWFFFSGHGMRHDGRDYLIPSDGDPEDIENTAISINFVTERLRGCGADNVVLILDACRSLATRAGEGIGRQTAEAARQQGVISIFSCSPQEYAYEIEELQQGAFTKALLEGLGILGQCATIEKLNQYLNFRVPEIVRQYKNAKQTPYIIAEPINKFHLILLPQYVTLADIATLKNDAYQAEVNRNLDLAEQLWIRVLAAASGQDIEAIKALQRIERLRNTNLPIAKTPQNPPAKPSPHLSRRRVIQTIGFLGTGLGLAIVVQRLWHSKPENSLKTFQFTVIKTNAQGKVISRQNQQAKYFVEDLGSSVTLEMVQIPKGNLIIGSLESLQPQVKISQFFMGKYEITQAQYQIIMGTNPSDSQGNQKPVEQVSWDDAVEFCQKLSQKTGHTYRLPSETEWEYACRAGTKTQFHYGETIPPYLVNCNSKATKPVNRGNLSANAFGLYDMHGNLWEWCQDYWHDNYNDAPTDGSAWLTIDQKGRRILRGGSWTTELKRCSSGSRAYDFHHVRENFIGFRVVTVVAAS